MKPKIHGNLRTADLNPEFTGSYKKCKSFKIKLESKLKLSCE